MMKVTDISLRMDKFADGTPALVLNFDLDGKPIEIAGTWATPTGIFQWGSSHEPDGAQALGAILHCMSRSIYRLLEEQQAA